MNINYLNLYFPKYDSIFPGAFNIKCGNPYFSRYSSSRSDYYLWSYIATKMLFVGDRSWYYVGEVPLFEEELFSTDLLTVTISRWWQ